MNEVWIVFGQVDLVCGGEQSIIEAVCSNQLLAEAKCSELQSLTSQPQGITFYIERYEVHTSITEAL